MNHSTDFHMSGGDVSLVHRMMLQLFPAVAAGLSDLVPWRPHPEVWAQVATLGGLYWLAIRRLGRWYAPPDQKPVERRQVAAFVAGLGAVWVVSDWPLHDIAEEFLLSVHMVEHLTLALVVPPLLLIGIPGWLWRVLLEPVLPLVRAVTHPMVGLFVFNFVFAATHWPPIIALQVDSELWHFVAHLVLVASAFLMFWRVFSPLHEIPRLPPFRRIGYLFLQTILPTIPASFLTFTNTALYPSYPSDVRLWGLDPVTDQQVAGLLMKLGGGLILWGMITSVFFRWAASERRDHPTIEVTAERTPR
jgi:putative membrane protein